VDVYGGFDPGSGDDTWAERDWVNNETILSGDVGTVDVNTDNSYHVVSAYDSDDDGCEKAAADALPPFHHKCLWTFVL
jgi:hypothetical protein